MIILFDLDSTLCDLTTPWINSYNNEFNDNVDRNDITDWDIKKFVKPEAKSKIFKYINTEGFYNNVLPNTDFIEEARELVELGHIVGICSSNNNNQVMAGMKLKWIRKHLPFLDMNNIMFVNNKGLAKADLLYDDRVLNIRNFLDNNLNSRGVIVRMPHNRAEIEKILGEPKYNHRITITEKEY